MKSYIGIDLGTTNSVICSYEDGQARIWKSPEQNDVTPSAIHIGRRGNKYVGTRAYDMAARSPENVAMLFKRFMGTSTPIKLPAVGITMTPEECSAEVLRALFGYLPEELRDQLRIDPEMGTVITVPAAFNQMQKNATMQAAEQAGIGRVALMQEPVAAVMSVMKARNTDGTFVIYDLGGGTLDVALAESLGGRINLLAHGGIAMCGGRDFDRLLIDNVVRPWLCETFNLPNGWASSPDYKSLVRLATSAAERAKIQLYAQEEVRISLSEADIRLRDRSGEDIYLDIPMTRSTLNRLIKEKVDKSIAAVRETLDKAGLSPHDVERIVFIGGPTNYKPLRDQVSSELGIAPSTEVNPMTAVAEGAALFAESIDWRSEGRSQKDSRGTLTAMGALKLKVNYEARTPDKRAKISIYVENAAISGMEYQIDSLDTGWTSGRLPLREGMMIDVSLPKDGENKFKVFVFAADGRSSSQKIVIKRTAATVDWIPASHAVGLVMLAKLGGPSITEWLVREGDQLPKKGTIQVKAGESLKAGSPNSLNFELREGESDTPQDNRPIGCLKVRGTDFNDEVIPAGADLQCDYDMLDSGQIILKVSIPGIGYSSEQNFYSRQEGQIDYSRESKRVSGEGEKTLRSLAEIERFVDDPRLEQARKKLNGARLNSSDKADPERVQEAMEGTFEARRLVAQVRKDHRKPIREMELEKATEHFNEDVRRYARPSEEKAFDNLVRTAQRSINQGDNDFESHLDELKSRNFQILWRQDWYVVKFFKEITSSPWHFSDATRFKQLVASGTRAIKNDNIDELRQIVGHLCQLLVSSNTSSSEDITMNIINIIRG